MDRGIFVDSCQGWLLAFCGLGTSYLDIEWLFYMENSARRSKYYKKVGNDYRGPFSFGTVENVVALINKVCF
jgi:hypothetical protein